MYKLSEEEYYEIGDRYGWNITDYNEWYLGRWVDHRLEGSISKYYDDLLSAEAAKEVREKLRLLQEALDA